MFHKQQDTNKYPVDNDLHQQCVNFDAQTPLLDLQILTRACPKQQFQDLTNIKTQIWSNFWSGHSY